MLYLRFIEASLQQLDALEASFLETKPEYDPKFEDPKFPKKGIATIPAGTTLVKSIASGVATSFIKAFHDRLTDEIVLEVHDSHVHDLTHVSSNINTRVDTCTHQNSFL